MSTPTRCLHLSASAVAAFKACPSRFRYAYIEGIRQIEDTDTQRMGTNWHKLQEVYRDAQRAAGCPAADTPVDPFQEAINHLNEVYSIVPDNKTADEWEIERTILASSFAGYVWRYQNDVVETLATEIPFDLPLLHPKTGMPLNVAEVRRVGKIDRIVRYNGKISIADYKSTSKPIDADSDFWNHLRLDSQISMYAMAADELARAGMLADMGVTATDRVSGAFYDVWHKPTLKPSLLTQKETNEFIETGKYLGSDFEVARDGDRIMVNGSVAEWKLGAKEGTGAIRETPAMFGVRLLADIYARPDFYFARREIARTDADIRRFRGQLYSIYQAMKAARDSGHWIENEHQCNATFRCPYTSICWHGVDVSGGQTPPGMKRIFTDITHERNEVEIA